MTPDFYSVSEKVVAALVVTGKRGAETISYKNSKTMQYVPLNIFPSANSPRQVPLNSVVNYMSRLTIERDFFSFSPEKHAVTRFILQL